MAKKSICVDNDSLSYTLNIPLLKFTKCLTERFDIWEMEDMFLPVTMLGII